MSDADSQLRILQAADGDPALLALAVVDLVHFHLPEAERARIREALLATAVPHWFDPAFLAALLQTTPEEAATLHARLIALSNVEPFPARGTEAYNVHEASRLPLRQHLRLQHPDLWREFAVRARAHVQSLGTEPHLRIEALFHLFAADQGAAVADYDALDRRVGCDGAIKEGISNILEEMLREDFLVGASLPTAKLGILWNRVVRGEISEFFEEAAEAYESALKYASPWREADALCLIGDVLKAQGHLSAACGKYAEYSQKLLELRKTLGASLDLNRDLIIAHCRLGLAVSEQGQFHYASQLLDLAVKTARRNTESLPPEVGLRELATALLAQGNLNDSYSKLDKAWWCYEEALELFQKLLQLSPTDNQWLRGSACALSRIGDLLIATGDLAGAKDKHSQAHEVFRNLAFSDRSQAMWQRDYGASACRLGDLNLSENESSLASEEYEKDLEISRGLVVRHPLSVDWKSNLGAILSRIGHVHMTKHEIDSAHACFFEEAEICRNLVALDDSAVFMKRNFAVSLGNLSGVLVLQGNHMQAFAYNRQRLALCREAIHAAPENAGFHYDYGRAHLDSSETFAVMKNRGMARKHFREGIHQIQRACDLCPQNRQWSVELGKLRRLRT